MTEAEINAEIERRRALPYTYLTRRDDDGTWFAQVKELRGCMTVGNSRDDALTMLDDAVVVWLEAALEGGLTIPEPDQDSDFSGRLVLRLPRFIHRDLSQRAEEEGVSLNSLLITALSAFLGGARNLEPLRVGEVVASDLYATALLDLAEAGITDLREGDAAYLASVASGVANADVNDMGAIVSLQVAEAVA